MDPRTRLRPDNPKVDEKTVGRLILLPSDDTSPKGSRPLD